MTAKQLVPWWEVKEGGISILLGFSCQIILLNSSFVTPETKTLIFMPCEVSFVQKLGRFECPRGSRSFRYYMLTLFLVRTVLCGDNILFSWGDEQIWLSVAFLMLEAQRLGRAKMMLVLRTHWWCLCISLQRINCVLHLLTLNLADLVADGWLVVTLLQLKEWFPAIILDRLCRDLCISRLCQLPFLNPVSLKSIFF